MSLSCGRTTCEPGGEEAGVLFPKTPSSWPLSDSGSTDVFVVRAGPPHLHRNQGSPNSGRRHSGLPAVNLTVERNQKVQYWLERCPKTGPTRCSFARPTQRL